MRNSTWKKLESPQTDSRRAGFRPLIQRSWSGIWLLGLMIALGGCATSHHDATETTRPFNFQTDTFAYDNELVWEYHFDEHGKWVSHPRRPEPDYTHHCFVVARSAHQFFVHARFDPSQPVADAAEYRRLIRQVVSTDPGRVTPDSKKIVIPGYPNMRAFSLAQMALLKSECGGAWRSYFQHGHWRIMLPFSRHHQALMARQFLDDLKADRPPVVHLVRFPQLTINHAVVVFAAEETAQEIHFMTYDPNNQRTPVVLIFDRASRSFQFAANDYFPGGRVNVYEVYQDWRY